MRDDESFLSAYLDGQLDHLRRQQVESALVADPGLAEELRRLTAVRDLVAGLPREPSVDLAGAVMERVGALPRPRAWLPPYFARRAGTRPALVAGAMFASAALVVFAISLALSMTLWLHPPDPAVGPAVAQLEPSGKSTLPAAPGAVASPGALAEKQPDSSLTIVSDAIAAATSETVGPPRSEPSTAAFDSPASRDLEGARQLLESPNLRRVFFARNGLGGKGDQEITGAIERATRFPFFKLTVPRGIVIDPRHPEEATVYAVVVGPGELEGLRERLNLALDDQVEDAAAIPGIVTQLADIRQVQSMPPSPLADVLIPRAASALRTPHSAPAETGELPGIGQGGHDAGTLEKGQNGPAPARGNLPAAAASERGARSSGNDERASTAQARPQTETAATVAGRSPDLAAGTGDAAKPIRGKAVPSNSDKPDEKIVVLVWVYKHRPG